MTPKEILNAYYASDLSTEKGIMEKYIHPDVKLHWHSSKGFRILDYDGMQVLYEDMGKASNSFRTEVSHLLEEGNSITARYTIYITPIETPDEEIALAHFITIWEVKDGKLYRGFEMSQNADTSPESLNSFK